MQKKRFLAAALALALVPLLSSSSSAQELSASYTKRTGNGHFSVSLGNGNRGYRAPSQSYGRHARVRSTGYYGGRAQYGGRIWIPGRYEVVPRKVWVPGYSDRVWVEPVFDVSCDRYGNEVRVLVREGYYRTVHRPGRYEVQRTRVWRSGHWRYR